MLKLDNQQGAEIGREVIIGREAIGGEAAIVVIMICEGIIPF